MVLVAIVNKDSINAVPQLANVICVINYTNASIDTEVHDKKGVVWTAQHALQARLIRRDGAHFH